MKVNLFLDDHRVPGDVTWCTLPQCDWWVVRSYDEFVNALREITNREWELGCVSFDHDLGWGHGLSDHKEKSGLDCAKWLVEWLMTTKRDIPQYTVHSMNPVGAANISGYIEGYRRARDGQGS